MLTECGGTWRSQPPKRRTLRSLRSGLTGPVRGESLAKINSGQPRAHLPRREEGPGSLPGMRSVTAHGDGVPETQLGVLAAPPLLTTLALHPKQALHSGRLSPGPESKHHQAMPRGWAPSLQLGKWGHSSRGSPHTPSRLKEKKGQRHRTPVSTPNRLYVPAHGHMARYSAPHSILSPENSGRVTTRSSWDKFRETEPSEGTQKLSSCTSQRGVGSSQPRGTAPD